MERLSQAALQRRRSASFSPKCGLGNRVPQRFYHPADYLKLPVNTQSTILQMTMPHNTTKNSNSPSMKMNLKNSPTPSRIFSSQVFLSTNRDCSLDAAQSVFIVETSRSPTVSTCQAACQKNPNRVENALVKCQAGQVSIS